MVNKQSLHSSLQCSALLFCLLLDQSYANEKHSELMKFSIPFLLFHSVQRTIDTISAGDFSTRVHFGRLRVLFISAEATRTEHPLDP